VNVYAFSPATDTAEIRRDLRGPYFERATQELHILDLRPSVPTRHRTFVATLTAIWLRLSTSPAASHLRAATRSAFWPLAISSGVILALVLLTYVQALAPVTAIR